MKLIYAIINSDDSASVSSALSSAGFFTTKIASTGGFLMSGNTTFICATEDEKVEEAIDIIKTHSKKRKQKLPASTYSDDLFPTFPIEVTVGGATIFVTNIEHFEKT